MAKDPDDRWEHGRGVRRAPRRLADPAAAEAHQGRSRRRRDDRHAQARHARPHPAAALAPPRRPAAAAGAPRRSGPGTGTLARRARRRAARRGHRRSCCCRATATTRATRPRTAARRRRQAEEEGDADADGGEDGRADADRDADGDRDRDAGADAGAGRRRSPRATPSQLQLQAFNLNKAGKSDEALPVAQKAVLKGCKGNALGEPVRLRAVRARQGPARDRRPAERDQDARGAPAAAIPTTSGPRSTRSCKRAQAGRGRVKASARGAEGIRVRTGAAKRSLLRIVIGVLAARRARARAALPRRHRRRRAVHTTGSTTC